MKKANQDEVVAFFTYFPEGITKKRLDHAMATNDDVAKFKKVRAITPDFQPTDDNPGSVVPLYPYIKKFGWEVRVLPLEKYSPILTTHISGNMIRLSSRQPDQTILIEDKNIADSQRQLFELVWEAAGEETELRPEEIQ